MISRFSFLDDNIKSLVKEITKKENEINKDCVVAEIIHLPPNPRVGNILKRGSIRSHEIEYFTFSNLASEKKISMADIMISIKNGRIYLRSKKNNRQIIPKLTSAHNFYKDTLPIYKFLCDLQHYNTISSFEIDFKAIVRQNNFIPRICIDKTIVSLATWILTVKDFQDLLDTKLSLSLTKDWRIKRHIPEKILLINGDNELLIDFSCDISVNVIISEVKKRGVIEVKEFLFNSDNLPIKSDQGGYLNEFIVPFYKKQ